MAFIIKQLQKYSFNFYSDESCHTENDGNDFIVLGTVFCLSSSKKLINKKIKEIKFKYGLKSDDELKWSKICPGNVNMYLEIIKFISDSRRAIHIRTCTVKNLHNLNLKQYGKDYEDWYHGVYYKMFEAAFKRLTHYPCSQANLIMDKKDSHSVENYNRIANYLGNKFRNVIFTCNTADSKEHPLLQIADIFIGAISYSIRNLQTSKAKITIINNINKLYNTNITTGSPRSEAYFNHYVWELEK